MVTLIDRSGMQADRLVVGTIAKSFAVPDKQLRVECPTDHRGSDNVIFTIDVCSIRNVEE